MCLKTYCAAVQLQVQLLSFRVDLSLSGVQTIVKIFTLNHLNSFSLLEREGKGRKGKQGDGKGWKGKEKGPVPCMSILILR